jgi:uncharacterized damage-inducible protein DinB
VENLQYPIGKFQWPGSLSEEQRAECMAAIEALPESLRRSVAGLSDQQLDTPYRPGGWTVRQVVHHVADSHLHSYVRFRFALTENEPPVKGYDEKAWAELADARTAPVELSLRMLDGIHRRWVTLLRALQPTDLDRKFVHSERGPLTLEMNLALYAWHGRHHLAHIAGLRQRNGW